MLRMTVNIMFDVLLMVERMLNHEITLMEDLMGIYRFSKIAEDEISFLVKSNWVNDQNGRIQLSEKALSIIKIKRKYGETFAFQHLLEDYILFGRPSWRGRIPYGRYEAFCFMSKDEQACFMEAELYDKNPNQRVIEWWDSVASEIRKESGNKMTDIGRLGEKLTIDYEKQRTGVMPQYIGFDTNIAGYDILSRLSNNDEAPLLIEVKASSSSENIAKFYISKNEWNTACNSKNYLFYLWDVSLEPAMLAIIEPEKMGEYIPENKSGSEWTSVEIPFNCFKDNFFRTI